MFEKIKNAIKKCCSKIKNFFSNIVSKFKKNK